MIIETLGSELPAPLPTAGSLGLAAPATGSATVWPPGRCQMAETKTRVPAGPHHLATWIALNAVARQAAAAWLMS
jgi:hypothetical protein